MRKEREMKGKRRPDTKLSEGHLLQLRDKLSKPVPKIKAMSQPGPADHPPVLSYISMQERLQRRMLSSAL